MTQDELTNVLNRLKDKMCTCDDGCKTCKKPTKVADKKRELKLIQALKHLSSKLAMTSAVDEDKEWMNAPMGRLDLTTISLQQVKEEEGPSELGKRLNGEVKGKKNDAGKEMFTCLPAKALLELGKVAELGARKYGLHNYRKGIAVSRTLDAAMRHLLKAMDGEKNDPIDGNDHLASAAWNCLVALNTLIERPDLDDRWKKNASN